MILSEITKIINAGPPYDANTGGLDGVYVSMSNYSHLTAIIQIGASAGAAPSVTVEKSASASGAGTQIAFRLRECITAYNASGGDTYYAAIGWKLSTGYGVTTVDNTFAVVEIDGSELGGYEYVRVRLSDPGAACLASICYILSDPRYPEADQPETIKV